MPGEKIPPITLKGKLIAFNSLDPGNNTNFGVRDIISTGSPKKVYTDHVKFAAYLAEMELPSTSFAEGLKRVDELVINT